LTKVCSNCKSSNPDNAEYCLNCGTKLNVNNSAKSNDKSGGNLTDFWNNQGNGGKIAIVVSVCCVGLILLFAIGSMVSPDKNTATTSTNATNTTTPIPATSTSSSDSSNSSSTTSEDVQIQVTYSGSWTGNYGDSSGSQSVEGSGSKTYTISGDPNVVSAVFQKSGDGNGTLTVNIIKSGQIVETKSTSASYGVVSVGHSFM
jgi:hypothetical protein